MVTNKENKNKPWSSWDCFHCTEVADFLMKGTEKASILFLLKGSMCITFGGKTQIVSPDNMILIPSRNPYQAELEGNSHVISVRFHPNELLSASCPPLRPSHFSKSNAQVLHPLLPINDLIREALFLTEYYIKDEIPARTLFELKVKEIFFLLLHTYDLNDIANFLYPILKHKPLVSNY